MAETLETKEEQKPAEISSEEKPEKHVEEKVEPEAVDEKTVTNGTDDDEGDSEEEELGSLEKPVEILSRKRERKSTERFALKEKKKVKLEDELDYTKGSGVKLGDVEFIKYSLDKTLADDLKPLHRLLYKQQGKLIMIKKNIRAFCGFPYDKDSEYYPRMMSTLDRFVMAGLRFNCGILGLEVGGTREILKERLIEFLMKPVNHEKPIPQKKVKSAKKKSEKSKKKKSKSPKKAKKEKGEKDEKNDEVSSASDDSDDDTKEKEEKEKPKKKKTPKKKESKKKEKKPTPVRISVPKKKTPKKKAESKRKNESDSEDDEPLLKKKKSEPTNEEVRKVVADILKDADLEQVTMKTVCRQVYDHFPDFDLTGRKDFIKTTVKEIIS